MHDSSHMTAAAGRRRPQKMPGISHRFFFSFLKFRPFVEGQELTG